MIKYYPSYYNDFACLADKCPDTCCAKWEIVIDDETLARYNTLEGELADRIKDSFIRNEDNEVCFALENERCPFLNKNGLCDIHIKLGEEYTSRICRDHPRFTEEYDGFTEISLSLSCPETVRLLLGNDASEDVYPVPVYDGDDEVLALLIASRKKLLSAKTAFSELSDMLLDTAADDQLDIDLVYVNEHPEFNICFIKAYLGYLLESCAVLNGKWGEYIENALGSQADEKQLAGYIVNNGRDLTRVLRYYIYRYYLKAVNDLDIYSRALFASVSCLAAAFVALTNDISFAEAARLYSKETEHNTDNTDLLISYLSEF